MRCEHCLIDFEIEPITKRPIDKKAKRPAGFSTQPIFAIRTVFGTHLCVKCWKGIKRNKPRSIPANANLMKFVRDIEAGKKSPPFKMSVSRNGVTDHSPIKLSAADLKKCGMER